MKKDKHITTAGLPAKLKLLVLNTENYDSSASSINNKNEILLTIHKPYTESYIYSNGKSTLIPVKSGNLCYASSINDHSEVVGGFGPEFHLMNAYHYKGGKLTVLPTLGGTTGATGINNNGLIVGLSTKGGRQCAVVWKNGQIIDLGTELPGESAFYDVNDNGVCVGYFIDKNKHTASFLYKDGAITIIKSQGECIGRHINNHNCIVGYIRNRNTNRAFLYKDNKFSSPTIKGNTRSGSNSINDSNIIAGVYSEKSTKQFGFLWKEGKTININSLIKSEYTVVNAQAINNRSYIVGQCTSGKILHACLLIPEA